MTRQMGYRRFIQSSPRINVHGIDEVVRWLGDGFCGVGRPILPSWCEKKTSVRSKSKSSKERSMGFIGVKTVILDGSYSGFPW